MCAEDLFRDRPEFYRQEAKLEGRIVDNELGSLEHFEQSGGHWAFLEIAQLYVSISRIKRYQADFGLERGERTPLGVRE